MFPSYAIADFVGALSVEGFHINRLELITPLPAHVVSPHKHLFYELFLLEEGASVHQVDFKTYDLTADTFFFIAQGQLHFWVRNESENIRGYRLMFTEDFLRSNMPDLRISSELAHFDNIHQYPCIQLVAEAKTFVYAYFDLLHREYCRSACYEDTLKTLLFLLLTELRRAFERDAITSRNQHHALIFKNFVRLLETNYNQKWTASDYAKALYISPRHLNRIVQAKTNQSLSTMIQHRTMLEARRLLVFSELSIRQVADQLGFDDGAYFARMFRKVVGQSPSNFKNTLSE